MAAEKIDDAARSSAARRSKPATCGQIGDAARPPATCSASITKRPRQHVRAAVDAARAARKEWASWSFDDRAAVILKAAELLTTSWRDTINAATMLGQSKTAFQAEIDAAAELVDFWRFNVHYGQELLDEQPIERPHDVEPARVPRASRASSTRVSPFNFTSIGGNLADRAGADGQHGRLEAGVERDALGAIYLMKLYEAAGMPPGVINFVAGDAAMISKVLLSHRDLAGVHFTGSTEVFNDMWKTIGASMSTYRSYPRIVGETGGKDFIVAHPSADVDALAVAIVRGGFEFQGQKCSAASRVYVPKSIWNDVRDRAVAMIDDIKMGDVQDFRNFMGAVIDKRAFDKISELRRARPRQARRSSPAARPTAAPATSSARRWSKRADPGYQLLCEEIFGPVVTAHVYDDAKWAETLQIVDSTSPYALTGAVFAQDRRRDRRARPRRCGTRPATSTSTTSRPARSSASSRSAARAVGHQRQGGIEAEPDALGQRADDEGELQPADGLPLPVHGRRVVTFGDFAESFDDECATTNDETGLGFAEFRELCVERRDLRGSAADLARRIEERRLARRSPARGDGRASTVTSNSSVVPSAKCGADTVASAISFFSTGDHVVVVARPTWRVRPCRPAPATQRRGRG